MTQIFMKTKGMNVVPGTFVKLKTYIDMWNEIWYRSIWNCRYN